MGDLLATGAAWLSTQLGSNAAHAVTYRRGSTTVTASASVGRRVFRINSEGDWLRIETRDFLIALADLSAAFGLPAEGDQIDETIDSVTTTYEVTGPGGEPAWNWSGPTRDRLRIHTLRISAQA